MRFPTELQAMLCWIRSRTARTVGDERGASIVEWVIIVAVLAGLAIAVGAIIVAKVTSKANGINLGN